MPDRASERLGSLLPDVGSHAPGKASRALAERLRRVESRNITQISAGWPVFWEEACGSNVRDADGNVFLDLSSAFGVALVGHGHPTVVDAVSAQLKRLVHGMGDVHPPRIKVELLERLCDMMPWPDTRAVLASTGSEAVEIALKTAQMATGRAGIIAFEGGYHGLTLGSLATTDRSLFRAPFADRMYEGVGFVPFPDPVDGGSRLARERALAGVQQALEQGAPNGDPIGAILIEPVQGRAGARVAPNGFMSTLSRMAADAGVLVIADEIFTGLGRCGSVLASERVGLRPDIVCLGKALGGGMPMSACVAPAQIMDAWPESGGEAIHTSTFLGHPASCAAALAVLDLMDHEAVVARARLLGSRLLEMLRGEVGGLPGVVDVRGLGLMIGIELRDDSGEPAAGRGVRIAEAALQDGLILLPAGRHGHVVELTPPVELTEEQTAFAVQTLGRLIRDVA